MKVNGNVNIKLAKWAVLNGGMLGMFLYGSIAETSGLQEGLLNISVFMLWVTSIVGLFGFMDIMAEVVVKDKKAYEEIFSVPKLIDNIFDVFVLLCLVYFGFFILAFIYGAHILGTNQLREGISKLMTEKNEAYEAEEKAEAEDEAEDEDDLDIDLTDIEIKSHIQENP